MDISSRSYLSAGVAVLGAGAIMLPAVQPLNPSLTAAPQKAISQMAVDLAAAVTPVDPIDNLIDVINDTFNNLDTLANNWFTGLYVNGTIPSPPNTGTCLIGCNGNRGYRTGGYETGGSLPILQQMANNLSVYLRELPDIGLIAGQIFGNIGNALSAPFEAGENKQGRLDGLAGTLLGVLDNFNQNVNAVPYVDVPIVGTVSQRDVGALLPVLAGAAYASLEPIINFATTPISGLLVGAIGPVVAPVLAVVNSISNAFALLQESNFGGALVELINIPANTIGAFLNGGQTLDLTPLLNLVGVTLPDEIKSLGLRMGGLLSPGGVAFDALAAEAEASGLAVDVPGLPVGPIGALAGLANYVSRSMVVTPPTEAQTPAETAAAVTAPEASAPAESTPAPQPIAAREADIDRKYFRKLMKKYGIEAADDGDD